MNLKTLPKLKKPKGLKKLPGLGKATKLPPLPKLEVGTPQVASLLDDELARLTNALGDERLAKKVLKLKEKYPLASTLECVIMEYLDRKRAHYIFQQTLLGGRKVKYGQVVDFLVDKGHYILIIEAQGNYWHTRKGQEGIDAAQRMALLSTTYQGKPILKVIAVWESRIMQPNRSIRERTLDAAMNGMELGK